MSVFQFIANAPLPIAKRITDNSVTTLVDATNNVIFVPWFQVSEYNNTTQNLTIDLYDGTTTIYLASDDGIVWNAEGSRPRYSAIFSQGIVVPKGSKIRATSGSASGLFHVVGMYVNVAR